MAVVIKNAQVRNMNVGPTLSSIGNFSYWNAASTYSYPRAGSTWYDIVGDNNGSMINMSGDNFDGEAQGIFVFDGTDEYVSVSGSESIEDLNPSSGAFTITAWIKPDTSKMEGEATYRVVNKMGRQSPGWSISVKRKTASLTQWQLYSNRILDTGSVGGSQNGGSYYDSSTWHYITTTYNADRSVFYSNEFKTRVNTSVDVSFMVPTGIGSISNTSPFEIGATATFSGAPSYLSEVFPGSIASVKFYKRLLSEDEIKQDYLSSKGRFGL